MSGSLLSLYSGVAADLRRDAAIAASQRPGRGREFLANMRGTDLVARSAGIGLAVTALLVSTTALRTMAAVLLVWLLGRFMWLYLRRDLDRTQYWAFAPAGVVGAVVGGVLLLNDVGPMIVLLVTFHLVNRELILARYVWSDADGARPPLWPSLSRRLGATRSRLAPVAAGTVAVSFAAAAFMCRVRLSLGSGKRYGYFCRRCRQHRADMQLRLLSNPQTEVGTWPSFGRPLFVAIGKDEPLALGQPRDAWLDACRDIDLVSGNCGSTTCSARTAREAPEGARCLVLAPDITTLERELEPAIDRLERQRGAVVHWVHEPDGTGTITITLNGRKTDIDYNLVGVADLRPAISDYDACLLVHSNADPSADHQISIAAEIQSLAAVLTVPEDVSPVAPRPWQAFHRKTGFVFTDSPFQPPALVKAMSRFLMVVVPETHGADPPSLRRLSPRMDPEADRLLGELIAP